MVDVNVIAFEIEVTTRHGDRVRADVYLPRDATGPFPVLLGASPYQMRPFLKHDRAEPIEPGQVYEFLIGLIPMSVLVAAGERLRLEISNWESAITEAPMTHWYGQKVGVDTYHHDAAHPSRLRLHERPRSISSEKVLT